MEPVATKEPANATAKWFFAVLAVNLIVSGIVFIRSPTQLVTIIWINNTPLTDRIFAFLPVFAQIILVGSILFTEILMRVWVRIFKGLLLVDDSQGRYITLTEKNLEPFIKGRVHPFLLPVALACLAGNLVLLAFTFR